MADPASRQRLDKWLWQARFFKTRTLASRQVAEGRVRVNSERTTKPALQVGVGDVLTFPQGNRVRVIRIEGLGLRRGPAAEAQGLYEDLTPPEPAPADRPAPAPRYDGGGRPTKRDRRQLDRARGAAEDPE